MFMVYGFLFMVLLFGNFLISAKPQAREYQNAEF